MRKHPIAMVGFCLWSILPFTLSAQSVTGTILGSVVDTSGARITQANVTAAFQTPATGLNGTLGRNVLYGPGTENWDLSFFKAFVLHEQHRLQFRTEMFNAFNHANFGPPVAVLSNPNFGEILSASAGRVIQFGLKYSF